jgi:hypothetical protein
MNIRRHRGIINGRQSQAALNLSLAIAKRTETDPYATWTVRPPGAWDGDGTDAHGEDGMVYVIVSGRWRALEWLANPIDDGDPNDPRWDFRVHGPSDRLDCSTFWGYWTHRLFELFPMRATFQIPESEWEAVVARLSEPAEVTA